MSIPLLRFMLPLRWFRWCRRDLGGRWELWQMAPRFDGEPFDEWRWFVDAEAARRHREHYRPFKVHAVEDYNVTRIDVTHVPLMAGEP
jgi:hypothetical protein